MNENHEIDLNHIQTMCEEQLKGIDIHVTKREIGNGPQFALEAYEEDSTDQLWESQWYSESEFEAYLEGMKNLELLFRKAEKER